ncbi:cGMP-dependent 3',5'-cyclic phosphodiesterase [Trichinella spiralis]|uniref:cGMP-dependent 3',5'-cyclic phosphodiesterase n=1 Tax=Trichinella spiralis TaxID=6334 RepID=UPI0001EFB32C|nr:cGMP-dependent 3',5'-cyclic phosphodiesterase [Trichinella spiralis]
MAQLVQSIIKDAKKLIPSEDCSLYLIDNDSNELVAEVVEMDEKNEEYLKEIRFPMNEGIVGQVAVSDVIAVIQLLNKIGTDGFTSHDQQLAELLSSYCAISISHLR